MRIISLLMLCFLVIGCESTQVRKYPVADRADKTIFVPITGSEIENAFKDELIALGWKIYVEDNSDGKITGTIGDVVNLDVSVPKKARYKLITIIRYESTFGIYWYQANLFDRVTGQEVLSINGKENLNEARTRFSDALQEMFSSNQAIGTEKMNDIPAPPKSILDNSAPAKK